MTQTGPSMLTRISSRLKQLLNILTLTQLRLVKNNELPMSQEVQYKSEVQVQNVNMMQVITIQIQVQFNSTTYI